MLATRLPWATIEAAIAPKLAHQAKPAKPAKRVIGDDLAGAFEGEFGGGISPAGRPRLPVRLMVSLPYLKSCWDNAPTESLWGRLKVDRLYGKTFATQRDGRGR